MLIKMGDATKEDFDKFIDELREDSKEKIIVVEGKKDKSALEAFGIKHIIVLRKPMYMIVEHIADSGKECVILTDLDREGKELYGKLAGSLKQFGVKIDDRYREFLFKTSIRQIEGIFRHIKRLAESGGELR